MDHLYNLQCEKCRISTTLTTIVLTVIIGSFSDLAIKLNNKNLKSNSNHGCHFVMIEIDSYHLCFHQGQHRCSDTGTSFLQRKS